LTISKTLSGLARAPLALVLAGCVTPTVRSSTGPWLEPSSNLKEQIDEQAQRLPWTHGLDRVELIRWFAAVGEPAYPTLLGLVSDERPEVAGAALAALGATKDSRLVPHLHEIPWPEEDHDLALERARTLVRLGDWSVMPILIEGLRDERLVTRALCAQALSESTNERFDYDPRGEPEAREQAVQRWEAWWERRGGDPELSAR
jgi:hypothetical protein